MIDTHTHLYLPEFEGDGGRLAVQRAIDIGVDKLIFPNVDLTTIEPMEGLAGQFPGRVFCAMGLHPTEVGEDWNCQLKIVLERLGDGTNYVAVGEVGIDLYWDKTYLKQQLEAFEIQVAKAVELNLPIIIHCRDGLNETLSVMQNFPQARAVYHSFGGTIENVESIRRVGDYYFGINGIVTFKNSSLRDVLPIIGLDRILLETDSPYLAPVPNRGKRNESSYLPHICAHIAQTLNVNSSQVSEITSKNANDLFGI